MKKIFEADLYDPAKWWKTCVNNGQSIQLDRYVLRSIHWLMRFFAKRQTNIHTCTHTEQSKYCLPFMSLRIYKQTITEEKRKKHHHQHLKKIVFSHSQVIKKGSFLEKEFYDAQRKCCCKRVSSFFQQQHHCVNLLYAFKASHSICDFSHHIPASAARSRSLSLKQT